MPTGGKLKATPRDGDVRVNELQPAGTGAAPHAADLDVKSPGLGGCLGAQTQGAFAFRRGRRRRRVRPRFRPRFSRLQPLADLDPHGMAFAEIGAVETLPDNRWQS